MTRVAICGGTDLHDAADALALVVDAREPQLAIVDADDDAAVAIAAGLPGALPRIFVAEPPRAALLRAAGVAHVVSRPLVTSALGPAVFAIERTHERDPRTFVFAAAAGATGRTSLAANLALRLSRRIPLVALDATGSGALAWRLDAAVAPWAEILAVGDELSESHLRLAAAEREGLLVVGGVGAVTAEEIARVVRVARAIAPVLLDAPPYWSARELVRVSDRVFLTANPDEGCAALTRAILDDLGDANVQLVVSQASERDVPEITKRFGHAPTYVLPRDELACAAALERRGPTGGKLGAGYDALAEILLAELVSP